MSRWMTHDLDRDLAAVTYIVGEIDRRHAAFTELTLDVVSARETRSERLRRLGHAITLCIAGVAARLLLRDSRRIPL